MTKLKKVVAVMLAFLMIFSSASVFASAWDATTDDGSNLSIATKFFKNVGGEWVETTKVKPNDVVKARVYLGTDYYSNDSALLFFYDKDFFTHSYASAPTEVALANTEAGSFAAENNVTTVVMANPNLKTQVNNGYIDTAFTDAYGAISVVVKVNAGNESNVKYDNSTWLFELELTVKEDAAATDGIGDLFVKDTTVQNSTTQTNAVVNVPKGPADGTDADIWAMWLWDANVTLSSQPVSTNSSVTFNANTGAFAADDTETFFTEGQIGTAIADAIPAISKDGYSFMGWVDATDTTPTYEEIVTAPTNYPEADLVLNAYWMENVDITFETDGGTAIPALTGVTPYAEFADIADPTKDGYTFKGWDVKGGDLPDTYPDVDTTYTAIWAKNVVVSFDTDGADPIEAIPGAAGDPFTATINDPVKEGHYFTGWTPALPTVFPEQDTTYTANYDTKNYMVNYNVDGKFAATAQIEYGQKIPTSVPTIKVPAGKILSDWYTDAACTVKLDENATMGAKSITLYAKTSNRTYNAIFNANGGEWADGNTTKTVPTVYEEDINAPEAPTKAGYVFAGWDPYPGTMDQANDMYFDAMWTEAENTIIYVVDNTEYDKFTDVAYGADLEVPADPDKEGYTFLGWSDVEGATEAIELPEKMPADSVTYYAVFKINQYTITFDSDGGTAVGAITQDYATDVTKPADPTKTGYTFTGWSPEVPSTMPAENVTVKAQWKINQYTITFDSDGGTAVGAITQDYATDVTAPANPTKTGYTFTGWSPEVPSTMPAENVTVKAQWKINQYTITFDSDGGTAVGAITQDYATDVTAPANPTKTGYTFTGWSPEVPSTMPAENVTVKAQWTINQYTITFDTDGGTAVGAITQDYATNVTKPADPTKTGYTFTGWSPEVPSTMPAENVTVTAQWTINNYDVTWKFDNGDADQVDNYDYNEAVTKPADPTKTGYTFAGWSDGTTTYAVGAEVPAMGAADITYTAQWTVNGYTVTWKFDNGTADKTETINYGDPIVAPTGITKTGYTFNAWSPALDATMPAHNVEYTATWTANSYDAKFYLEDTKTDADLYATVPTAYDSDIVAPGDEDSDIAAPTKEGYVFGGWQPAVGTMNSVDGLEFVAKWNNALDTKYTVITYTMNTEGAYEKTSEEEFAGETNDDVDATPKTVAEGFTFNADESEETGKISPDGKLVLTVYIARNMYTLTTDVDGAKTEKEYYYDATVSVAAPSKVGYTFAGWEPAAPAKMPANDMEIKATWTANSDTEYRVVVNYKDVTNGGADATFEPNDGTPYQGTTGYKVEFVNEIPDPAAENTEYVLWSDLVLDNYKLDESAANEFGETIAADGSTVINLYYIPVKYTATFRATDGTYEAAFTDGETSKAVDLDYYSIPNDSKPADPVRDGYTFAGWGTAASRPLNANRVLTAEWDANEYKLTFDGQSGKFQDGTGFAYVTADCDSVIQAPVNPTREGYKFLGWAETAGQTTADAAVTVPTTMPAGDKTYYAIWEIQQYTVTFYLEEDKAVTVDSFTQNYGTEFAVPTATKTGYSFASWMNAATDAVVTFTDGKGTIPEGGAEYYATWNINKYTITFDTDGGTTVNAITQDYNTSVTKPANPTKTGYTFNGWSPEVPSTMPAEDITVTAQWTINQYTITFDTDGGSTVAPITQDYNTAVTAPADPTKTGYTFKGWAETKGADESAKVVLPANMPAENQTYYAIWVIDKYTITFNSQGGTDVESVTADYNSPVAKPADPTKKGYTFGGWATAADSTTAVTFPVTMPLNGTTYYAIWTIESYTVNWLSDGVAAKTETADYNATLAAPAVTKTGYTLSGWLYNGTSYPANATVTIDDAGDNGAVINIEAQWTPNSYDAIFNANGGSWDDGATKTVSTVFDTQITIPAEPTRDGYNFNGWVLDGVNIGKTPVVTMNTEGKTFTAEWLAKGDIVYTVITYTMNTAGAYEETSRIQYTGTTDKEVDATPATVAKGFTFNADASEEKGVVTADGLLELTVYLDRNKYNVTTEVDGTGTGTTEYYYEATVIVPDEPTKTGYIFSGWSADGTSYNAGATFSMPANDVTLKGTFTINKYTITFDTDGGTEVAAINQDYNTAVTAPADPTKAGYTFKGWAETKGANESAKVELPANMPAENQTYYAIWAANNYTITFNTDGGSTVAPITQAYGSAVTAPADPTKTGNTFAGWYDENNNKVNVPATMPLGDMTLTAHWTVNQYTVTFYEDSTKTKVLQKTENDYGLAINPPAATLTGHELEGWYDADGNKVDFTATVTTPANDVEYYAKWTVLEYALTYRGQGGSWDNGTATEKIYNVAYGTAKADMPAPAENPTRTGYTFNGWNRELPDTMPAEPVNLIAQWTKETYTINWVSFGQVIADASFVTSVAYGDEITSPEMSKTGYTFDGWSYNGTTYPAGEMIAIADAGDNGATITIEAQWTANSYNAVFNANGGSWDDGATKTVPTDFDEEIVIPAEPTRAGYNFNGWMLDGVNVGKTPVVVMDSVNGKTFTADWVAQGDIVYTVITYTMNTAGAYEETSSIQYTGATDTEADATPTTVAEGFVFNADESEEKGTITADGKLVLTVYLDRVKSTVTTTLDGTVIDTAEGVLYGATVTVPATPSKEGYTFNGWTVNDVAYESNSTFEMPAKDVAIVGTYTVNQYDATFYVDNALIATVPTNFGEVPVAPTATKDGYTFTGWNPALKAMDTDGERYDAVFTANGDTPYTVEIYTMGLDGEYGEAEVLNKTGATDSTATYVPEAKEGFTAEEVSGTITADGKLVLKVYYVREKFTLTYKVDGGVYSEEEYYYGAALTTLEEPTKEGYTFSGWSQQAPATMPAEDVEITGTFAINTYKITYIVDGEEYKVEEYEYQTTGIATLAEPVKEGYTFSGWSAQAPATMPAKDVEITGTFAINTYKITYKVDGAEYKVEEYEYNTTGITTLEEPTKEGYTFSGWSQQAPATMPAKDVEITGTFTVNKYDATFYVDNVLIATVPTNFGEIPVAPTATKTGYTFQSWNPELKAMDTDGERYDAIFTANSGIAYTVETYKMATDGKYPEAPASEEVLYGTAGETVTAATPDIEGFTYNAEMSANTVSGTVAGDGSLVLKIYYDRNKITVNVNGNVNDYYYGQEIPEPAKPEDKEGNEHTGWQDENGNKVEFPYTVPDEEDGKLEITPVYTPINYTATFVIDGETAETKSVAYGSVIGVPAIPDKAGYTTIGWQDENGAFLTDATTMPAKNVTYTAIYEVGTTNVDYYVNGVLVGSVSCENGEVIPTVIPTYKVPTGYTLSVWYTDAGFATELADGATFGSGVTALYAYTTAKEYEAIFNANGGSWADGDTTKTVIAAFDADIDTTTVGLNKDDAAAPTREGYTFLGWEPYVGTMDAEGMTFTAQWIETANAYTITYIVDGDTANPYQVFTIALNDEFEVPAEPDKEGYTFLGWASTADATAAETLPDYMPAKNLTYHAVFSVNNYTATFYNYEEFLNADGVAVSPWKTDVPVAIEATGYDYGKTIVFPADPTNINSAYWTFVGWSTEEDGEVIADTSDIPMGAADVAYYAVYERVAIKLMPVEGSTAMVERDGVIESYNDGYTVTDDQYADPDSYEEWFIYGFEERRMRESTFANYVEVTGDATIVITETENGYGTGTLIQVIDNVEGDVEEEFFVIIFGDLDGDGRYINADVTIMTDEVYGITKWQRTGDAYLFRAADLDGDGRRINNGDLTNLKEYVNGLITIDQTVGYVE